VEQAKADLSKYKKYNKNAYSYHLSVGTAVPRLNP